MTLRLLGRVLAARTTTSSGGKVAIGVLFITLGSALLLFSSGLANLYREMMTRRPNEAIVVLSAYIVPTVFVVAGVGAVVAGFAS